MHSPRFHFCSLLVLVAFLWSHSAHGQSYSSAIKKYRAGDLVEAEDEFSQVAAKSKGLDLAATLKMLGVCQYMLGDTASAKATFTKALGIDPNLSLSGNDVLDDSVLDFFSKVKSSQPNASASQASTTPAPSPATKPKPAPAKAANTTPAKSAAKPAPAKKAPPKTLLNVSSNVRDASVLAGGIQIGKVDSLIEVRPGFISLEISLPGYETQRKNVTVREGQTNFVRIEMKKMDTNKKKLLTDPPPPIEPLQPIAPPGKGTAAVKTQSAFGVDEKGIAIPKGPKGQKNAKPVPITRSTEIVRSADVLKKPSNAAGLTQTNSRVQKAAPSRPANEGTTVQSSQRGKKSPVPEESLASGAASEPVPAASSAVSTPAAPPSASEKDKLSSDPTSEIEAPSGEVNTTPAEGKKKKRGEPRGPESSGHSSIGQSVVVTLLPFGAGQFQNESYVKGGLFAVAEVSAVYYYFAKSEEAQNEARVTNAEIDRRLQEEEALEGDVRTAYQQETDDYAASQEKKVSDLEFQSSLGIGGFSALWAIGVIEALINRPPPGPVDSGYGKPQKAPGGQKAKSKSAAAPPGALEELTASQDPVYQYPVPAVSFHVSPATKTNVLPRSEIPMVTMRVDF